MFRKIKEGELLKINKQLLTTYKEIIKELLNWKNENSNR